MFQISSLTFLLSNQMSNVQQTHGTVSETLALGTSKCALALKTDHIGSITVFPHLYFILT